MSISVNKVILQGRVGQKPRVSAVKDKKVAQFSLATTNGYGEDATTEWHNVVAWSPTADNIEKYVDKGRELYIEGRLRTRKYTNSAGEDRVITEILADIVKFGADPNRAQDGQRTARRAPETNDDLPFGL